VGAWKIEVFCREQKKETNKTRGRDGRSGGETLGQLIRGRNGGLQKSYESKGHREKARGGDTGVRSIRFREMSKKWVDIQSCDD